MLRSYLKIAWRNLIRNKAYAVINGMGLSVAFGAAALLLLAAQFEWSFDQFHANKGQVYRLSLKEVRADRVESQTNMPVPMMPALKAAYAGQIRSATRYEEGHGQLIRADRTWSGDVLYVDADFLRLFSFPFLVGNGRAGLHDPNQVVLSRRVATSVFGTDNPVGQTLTLNVGGQRKPFVVSGVIADAPINSTLRNDVLVRFENFPEYESVRDRWNWRNHDVFLQLADGISGVDFERSLQPFVRKQYANDIAVAKRNGAQPDERGEVLSLRLTALADLHFDRLNDSKAIDPVYPIILLGVSLLILLIAGINFVNLSTTRSLGRAKEVGMRKALGAGLGQIVGQFWGEALLVCLAAFGVGLLLAIALLEPYNRLFVGHLSWTQLGQPTVWGGLLIGFVLVTGVAGGYPAWLMGQLPAVAVLKGRLGSMVRVGLVRNTLIVVQFAVSVLLIGCTLIVWQQIRYVRDKPLGYAPEQVISIPVGYETDGYRLLTYLREHLSNQPSIVSITGADLNLGQGKDGSSGRSRFGFGIEEKPYQTNAVNIDFDYEKTLGLRLIAGRNLSRQYATDSTQACLINESMARQLGRANPVGLNLPLNGGKTIVGVVSDYHFESLRDQIGPMTLFFNKPFGLSYLFVRVRADAPATTMALLERTYRAAAPRSVFQGTFLTQNISNQYQKEQRLATVLIAGAWLAILLSCVGLFAVALMTIQARTKEIGVRKVLGASVTSITALLAGDFLKLVGIAIVIASPLAWWTMNRWLQDFAYKIDIEWWVFALAGLLAVGIALLTVGFQSVKAALSDPVKSLRSE